MSLKNLIRIKKASDDSSSFDFEQDHETGSNEFREPSGTSRFKPVVFDNSFDDSKEQVYSGNYPEESGIEDFNSLDQEEHESVKKRGFFKRRKKNKSSKKRDKTESVYHENPDSTTCASVNVVPFDWSKEFLFSVLNRRISVMAIKNTVFLTMLVGVFVAFFFVGKIIVSEKERSFQSSLNRETTTVNEYTSIAENIAAYKNYTKILNNPGVYTQFWGTSYLLARNGFLVSTISFDKTVSSSVLGKLGMSTFAVETGSSLENIDLRGVWTFEGMISPRVETISENEWQMNFGKQVQTLFNKQGLKSYTKVVFTNPGGARELSSVTLIILLWK